MTQLGNCDSDLTSIDLADVSTSDESTINSDTPTRDGGTVAARLYQVNSGGHTLPHPENQLFPVLENTNRDINLAKEIWAFFDVVVK